MSHEGHTVKDEIISFNEAGEGARR